MHDNEPTGPTAAAGSRAAGLSSAETGSARRLPTVSLELFPPRPGKAASATWGRIDRLLATGPDFVSVTYRPTFVTDPAGGINGGEYEGSVRGTEVSRCKAVPCVRAVQEQTNPSEFVLAHVLESSTIPLMAHLTCIGYRKQEAVEIVTRFLRMGVRRFLALRGDPPAGTRADEVAGELRHADDLVRVIREVEADFFGDGRRHVTIAVAAYPATSDHIEAIEVLAAKQTAGADMAITQVFYDAADYVALTNAASYAGVSIPILPGVIPLTDLRRLTRLEALTGVRVPESLHSSLGSASGATLVERGIGATLDLATALLRAGADDAEWALARFEEVYRHETHVLDKWFTAQATMHGTHEPTLARVKRLMAHPGWDAQNPNKVRALLYAFFNSNLAEFHRPDGEGYALWLEQVLRLDRSNPQVAARMARTLNRHRRFVPALADRMQAVLAQAAQDAQSPDVREVIAKELES